MTHETVAALEYANRAITSFSSASAIPTRHICELELRLRTVWYRKIKLSEQQWKLLPTVGFKLLPIFDLGLRLKDAIAIL
ncbi:hypothetical protein H6G35_36355 [Aulosira sp. FACHB-113]|nr:hypothetical protein [Aulosira sp. FACHB-113]